ncbi:hypothetical protein ERO13_D02G144950v2 [Gossypium hirsutum]|nr:hypothetical protein ERO13_D02G144950v2 [Gossypium hirsutum]
MVRCWKESFKCMRVVMLVALLLLSKASVGGCMRPMIKGSSSSSSKSSIGNLLNAKLPRGPVPPSGPSPCHEKLYPYSMRPTQLSYPHDFIICP